MTVANALIQKLVPKDKRFYPLFDEFGATVQKACDAYAALLETQDLAQRKLYAEEIRIQERNGDIIINRIVTELTATFITPFDREDIHRLASTLDGILDDLNGGARRIVLYEVVQVPTQLLELGRSIQTCGRASAESIHMLKNLRKPQEFASKIRIIQEHKSVAEDTFLQGMASLYSGSYDSNLVLKLREIFYATDNALRYFQELSFALEAILIKTT